MLFLLNRATPETGRAFCFPRLPLQPSPASRFGTAGVPPAALERAAPGAAEPPRLRRARRRPAAAGRAPTRPERPAGLGLEFPGPRGHRPPQALPGRRDVEHPPRLPRDPEALDHRRQSDQRGLRLRDDAPEDAPGAPAGVPRRSPGTGRPDAPRHDAYAEYKANRPRHADDLASQLPISARSSPPTGFRSSSCRVSRRTTSSEPSRERGAAAGASTSSS